MHVHSQPTAINVQPSINGLCCYSLLAFAELHPSRSNKANAFDVTRNGVRRRRFEVQFTACSFGSISIQSRSIHHQL